MNKLGKEFFLLPATSLAPLLLGKVLCRYNNGEVKRHIITETECYFGAEDTACHARRGITKGNSALFEEGGIAYVYLCYGIHYLFNIVSGVKGHGEGVLIRGIEGVNGPGRVTRLLEIDKSFNGIKLYESGLIWVEDWLTAEYTALPRVGIDYADKKDRERLWRYVMTQTS